MTTPLYSLDISGNSYLGGDSIVTGNLGIGTTNPSYNLDVNGNSYVSNDLYVNKQIGIGTTNPAWSLDIPNGSINALTLSSSLISSLFKYFVSTNSNYFYTNGTIGTRLLIQWGYGSAANVTLTFTLPYSNAPSVIAVGNGGTNGTSSYLHTQSICVYNVTTTNCIVGQFTLNDPFYWIAVGIF